MTTPTERTRALLWGSELLISLAAQPSVAGDAQAHARAILGCYPTLSDVHDWLDRGVLAPPQTAAEAIEEAFRFFSRLQRQDSLDQDLQRQLTVVLRHFPPEGAALSAARLGFFGGISEWLAA